MSETMRPALSRAAAFALDMLLPARCLVCGEAVEGAGEVCARCWPRIAFLGPPHCAACGTPFAFDEGAEVLCGSCLRRRPVYRRARAVIGYDDASRAPVLAFKHADRTDAAPVFGRWMARVGAELLGDADILVPVPLHRSRLLARRYNQAALLANEVSRTAGVKAVPELLVRARRTPSQGGLGAGQRRRNVQGAFRIRAGMNARLKDARVLLIDDVLTTGATADSCARTLLGAGAAAVDVLTLARVVRAGE